MNEVAKATPNALEAILADPEKLSGLKVETLERLFKLQREARADQAREDYAIAFNRRAGVL